MSCDHRRSHVVDSRKKEGFVYRRRICPCGVHIYTKEYLVGGKNVLENAPIRVINTFDSVIRDKTPNISHELQAIMDLATQIGGTKQKIFHLFIRKIQLKLGAED